jgi:4-hydroxy-tetrahydrodipicolinate synthase
MEAIKWRGIFPAITTKFTDKDELDFHWIEKNSNAQIDAGVSGLVLAGTLGEASTLSNDEKDELLRFSLEKFGKQVYILMNIAESTTKKAIEAAQNAEKAGAHGIMLLPPMRYISDERETLEFLKTVIGSISIPVLLYNNPNDYKIEITLKMFDELLKFKNVQAVKESTRDITNVTRLRNAYGNDLKILTGVDTIGMESLVMGADGWVAGLVCAFPKETVAIYALVKAGKYKEALDIFRWFMPVLELDINTKLVQNIKLAESLTGIGTENVRAPRLKLAGKERENVLKIINDALDKRPKLPNYKEYLHKQTTL